MMNKFRGPDDANFELVSSTIKEMVGKAKKITLAQREGKISPQGAEKPRSTQPPPLTDVFSNGCVQSSCKYS